MKKKTYIRLLTILCICCLTLALTPMQARAADELTVTSAADSGEGTLRAALAAVTDGGTIKFADDVTEIALNTALSFPTDKSFTIDGLTASGEPGVTLTPASGVSTRLLENDGLFSGSLTVRGVTFENGAGGQHGGAVLYAAGGSLTVEGCVFTGNSASHLTDGSTAWGQGGAIFFNSGGTLTLRDCTFTNNSAAAQNSCSTENGLVFFDTQGGAVYATAGNVIMTGCTFTNNSVTANHTLSASEAAANNTSLVLTNYGGAVYVHDSSFTMANCTFDGNKNQTTRGSETSSADYGAVYAPAVSAYHCTFIRASDDSNTNLIRATTLNMYNSFVQGSVGSFTGAGNEIGASLTAPSMRVAALTSTQVSNADILTALAKDINGANRPTDFVTVGAREIPSELTVTSAADSGEGTLRAALATVTDGGTIKFDADVTEITLNTALSFPTDRSFTIDGLTADGKPGMSIRPSGNNIRILESSGSGAGQLTLQGLVLRGVFLNPTGTDAHGGAILATAGSLKLDRCELRRNSVSALNASGRGGAVYFRSSGDLTISDCFFSDNSATASMLGSAMGGAVYFEGGSLLMANCTFQSNYVDTTDSEQVLGGAVYAAAGTAELYHCTVLHNPNFGGGSQLASAEGVTLTLTNCLVCDRFDNTFGGSSNWISGTVSADLRTIFGRIPNGHTVPLSNIRMRILPVNTTENATLAELLAADAAGVSRAGKRYVTAGAMELPADATYWITDESQIVDGTFQFMLTRLTTGETIAFHENVTQVEIAFSTDLLMTEAITIDGGVTEDGLPRTTIISSGDALEGMLFNSRRDPDGGEETLTLKNLIFLGVRRDNMGEIMGGMMHIEHGNLVAENCVFSGWHVNNTAPTVTGNDTAQAAGAVLRFNNPDGDVTLKNCVFVDNKATVSEGGAPSAYTRTRGGAIWAHCHNFTAINCSFINNEAEKSSALDVACERSTLLGTQGEPNLYHCTFVTRSGVVATNLRDEDMHNCLVQSRGDWLSPEYGNRHFLSYSIFTSAGTAESSHWAPVNTTPDIFVPALDITVLEKYPELLVDGNGARRGATVTVGAVAAVNPPASSAAARLRGAVRLAQPGETVREKLPSNGIIPGSILQQARDKGLILELDAGDGLVWVIDGTKLPAGTIPNVNLGITGGVTRIPVEIINRITGTGFTMQLELSYSGEFGIEAVLRVTLSGESAGLWANLYFHNTDTGKLEYRVSGRLSEDGTAELPFTRASGYVIVLDRVSHAAPFLDVAEGAWYNPYVLWAYRSGVMVGVGNDLFSPTGTVTRAEIWTVIARVAGAELAETSPWYESARLWAMEHNVSDGTNATEPVTREQLVTMLWRAAGEPEGAAVPDTYTDRDEISDYALAAFGWAIENGVINGTSSTTLSPRGEASRAQLATILQRIDH